MKKIFFIIPLMLIMIYANVIFCATISNPDSPSIPSTNNQPITEIDNATNKIWGTFVIIAQTLSIAAIVFTGLRYMFTNADDRADIKLQTIILVIGSVLVFAAVPFAEFIVGIVGELFP